jgi:uncharacterized membrane protein
MLSLSTTRPLRPCIITITIHAISQAIVSMLAACLQMTKLRQESKAACDASFRLGGQRGASQVLCNSAGGALAAAAAAAAAAASSSSQHGHVLQLLAWSAFLVRAAIRAAAR